MSVTDLVEEIQKIEKKNNIETRTFLSHIVDDLNNNHVSVNRARKIEIALDLPKFELVKMVTNVDELSKVALNTLDEIERKYKK